MPGKAKGKANLMKGALSSLNLTQDAFSVDPSPQSLDPGRYEKKESHPVAVRIRLTIQFDFFLLLSFKS